MKAKIFTIILLIFSLSVSAQKNTKFSFQGKVTDSLSNQPLSYAHIKILNSNFGTTTNKDGQFIISFSSDSIVLEISYVGYENKIIKSHCNELLDIKLNSSNIILEELVIRNENPTDILINGLNIISQVNNEYIVKNTAFYREIISENKKYTEFAEGIIEIQRFDNKNYIKIKKAQKAKDLKKYELSKITTITLGGPHKLLKNDILFSLPDFLSKKRIDEYNFELLKTTFFNNEEVKIIGFTQKDNSKKQFISGEITITANSNDIVKVYFNEKTKPISNFLMKMFGLEFHGDEQKTTVSYQKLNDEWVLKSIHKDSKIYMSKTKNGTKKDFHFLINSELIITSHSKNKSFNKPKEGYLKPGKEFGKQILKYDKNFWLEYSTIKTTKEQNLLLKELIYKNKSNRSENIK